MTATTNSEEGSRRPIRAEFFSILGGRRVRRRFICPCGRGAWHVYAKGEALVCRHCAGKSHRRRSAIDLAVALRLKLGLDPRPFSPLPIVAPPWSRARWYLLVAEVQRLEASAYSDFARALGDVERLASDLEL